MAHNNYQEDFNEPKAQNDRDLQQKLEELEAQVYQTTQEQSTPPYTETEFGFSSQISNGISAIRNWFNQLPQAGKLLVGIVGVIVGFSVLNLFVSLITKLITLAIFSLILYGLYKYLFSASETK